MTTNTNKTSISLTLDRAFPNGDYVQAHIMRRGLDQHLSAGYSVTGSLWEKHGTWSGKVRSEQGREWDCGGCIHDEVAKVHPDIDAIIALHLSDLDGVPMHAVANGWYSYTGQEVEHRSYNAEAEELSVPKKILDTQIESFLGIIKLDEDFDEEIVNLGRAQWEAANANKLRTLESDRDKLIAAMRAIGKKSVARLFRMDEAEIPEGMSEDRFHEFADEQRPRWLSEAEQVDEIIERLSSVKEVAK